MYYNLTLKELVKFIMDIIVKHLPFIDKNDYCNTTVPSSKVLCVGVVADIRNGKNHQRTLKEFEIEGLNEFVLDKSQFSRRILQLDYNIAELVSNIAIDQELQLSKHPMKQAEIDTFVIDTNRYQCVKISVYLTVI